MFDINSREKLAAHLWAHQSEAFDDYKLSVMMVVVVRFTWLWFLQCLEFYAVFEKTECQHIPQVARR